MNEDVAVQVEKEKKELESLPQIPLIALMPSKSGNSGRCYGCGKMSDNLVACHDEGPNHEIINERWKGKECCGGRHS